MKTLLQCHDGIRVMMAERCVDWNNALVTCQGVKKITLAKQSQTGESASMKYLQPSSHLHLGLRTVDLGIVRKF